ncbi:MAG: NAD(P)/FAD-dependent oxidoreductase [Bacilli bacterium]
MIKISNVKVDLEHTIEDVLNKCFRILKTDNINNYYIEKKSLDARKNKMQYIYSIIIDINNEKKYLKHKDISIAKRYTLNVQKEKLTTRPIIIGSGPCGLFAALILTLANCKPIIIERGKDADQRKIDIDKFWETGILNSNSNVQFGEGGAGTFSDGKLTTQVKNPRTKIILDYLVQFGADEEIKYLSKPHIGTDILINVIKNMRKFLIDNGAEFLFEHKLTNLNIENDILKSIDVIHKNNLKTFKTDYLFLAIGHSARDTFELLYDKGLDIEQKPFAMGVRIEHLQTMVNKNQYGDFKIGAAEYKLTTRLKNGRGAYTFCMCPGGVVVGATSEEGMIVTNGMSYHARNLENANSALLVNVNTKDFNSSHPLQGMYLQQKLERRAYELGGGNFYAPVQTVKDFLNNQTTTKFGSIKPTYKPGVKMANLHEIFPDFLSIGLIEALNNLNLKFEGFNCDDAILTAIESRTSSPIRIKRNEQCFSNIKGIIPCGEGAGYAGGIMSAAIDGINVVEKVFDKVYVVEVK